MNDYSLYLNYLKNELYFCDISINNIDIIASDDSSDAKMLFYHSNVLFNSLANISKILNSNVNDFTIERSKSIKNLLHIKNKKITILNNRQYRHSNEHYDERIDFLLENNVDDCSHIDFSVFTYINANNFTNFGRLYIVSERAFYFTNADILTEKIYLSDIEGAINYIKEQLNSYYLNG